MENLKRNVCVAAAIAHLATSLPATADCMGAIPRYVEMTVESCSSAAPLVQSAIVGKGYSVHETELVRISAQNLYVIRARPLADVDLIEWYSRGDIRRYLGKRMPIESQASDYMVVSHGGCELLSTGKALIFDINPAKPCRDVIVIVNGKKAAETDARAILALPEAAYLPDQEQLEDWSLRPGANS